MIQILKSMCTLLLPDVDLVVQSQRLEDVLHSRSVTLHGWQSHRALSHACTAPRASSKRSVRNFEQTKGDGNGFELRLDHLKLEDCVNNGRAA